MADVSKILAVVGSSSNVPAKHHEFASGVVVVLNALLFGSDLTSHAKVALL